MEKTSTKLISCPHCKREFNDNIVWNQFNVNTHVKSCQTKMMPNKKKKLIEAAKAIRPLGSFFAPSNILVIFQLYFLFAFQYIIIK
jgi:hypothetical protein